MAENNDKSSLHGTIVTTCGTVAVALIGAVSVYMNSGSNTAINKAVVPASTAASSKPEAKPDPLLDPEASTWLVQLGFFASRANAEMRVKQLEAAGFTGVKIVKSKTFPGLSNPNGNYVVLGPVTEAEAIELIDKAKNHIPDAYVANGYYNKK